MNKDWVYYHAFATNCLCNAGLGTLDGGQPLELEIGSFLPCALNGAVYVSESFLVFLFAAVAVDFCYKMGGLSPFPIEKTASETN